MSPQHPGRIGKYEILGILGQGGMGIVYRAQDKRMGREVAIKTVTEDFSKDTTMLERFYQEAEKTGRLKHPNIVTVYDLGEQDGMPYIVMELVDGQPLDKIIKESRTTPLLEKLRIIEQVCSALGYAHQHDVIHRDVKPANVIVHRDGSAKLLDFGIAREEKRTGQGLTRTGAVIGTVPYMAPERLRGGALDARSDIFAVGVMLYQTLTGQLPFQGEDGVLVTKLLNEKHPPLSTYLQEYPPMLDTIIDRALAKNPDDRYPTAEEMATELFALIDKLKREHIGEVVLQVKRLSEEQEYVQARDALLQVLKLDNQHTEARRLLAEVQQHLSRKQRDEQAQQLSLKAEDLVREKHYDQAIELLDQAAKLVPDDRLIFGLLESTRKKKVLHEQIDGFLRRADAARSAGDISGARDMVAKALELDAHDSRVQIAYTSLARQAEEQAARAKARKLMDDARAELKLRRYSEALVVLREANEIDPLNMELQAMLSSATAGAQQEQRRKLLDEVEREVTRAVTREQAQAALITIQAAIDKTGADPVLLRLQAQVTRQLREFDAKRLVEETVRDCRALMENSPLEALNLVEAALMRLPTNEHLLNLKASIDEQLARLNREERRANYLKEAHKAVAENRFSDAVHVLEGCEDELQSNEIAELLEFARNEVRHEEHRQFVAATMGHGQQLIRDCRYQDAIDFLAPILADAEEIGVRALLRQAESLLASLAEKAEAAAAQVEELLQIEAYEQALAYLETLPGEMKVKEELQQALEHARAGLQREQEFTAFLGESYALLDSQNPGGEWLEVKEEALGGGVMAEMVRALHVRREGVATQRITAETEMVRAELLAGNVQAVVERLEVQRPLLPYCTKEVQLAWGTLVEECHARKNSGMMGKFGRKGR